MCVCVCENSHPIFMGKKSYSPGPVRAGELLVVRIYVTGDIRNRRKKNKETWIERLGYE